MIRGIRRLVMVTSFLLASFALAEEPDTGTEGAPRGYKGVSAASRREPSVAEREEEGFFAKLEKHGVSFDFQYTGEVFYGLRINPDGETRTRGLISLTLELNTEKLGLWPGGEFFLTGENGHGEGFTVDPGGVATPISNIDAGSFTQIAEYGLKQSFADGRLQLHAGKKDVNTLFCVNGFGQDLINPSYALIPTVPMPTFPAPALGSAVFAEPAEGAFFGLGFYDGGPRTGSLGLDTFYHGAGGYFMVLEPAWKPAWGETAQYPGSYRLGLWFHTGDFAETGSPANPRTFSGNYGIYLLLDQWIYRIRGKTPDEDRGLGAFFQCGWAPSDRNPMTRYVGAGLSCKGLLPGRTGDAFGIGAGYTRLAGPEGDADLTNVEVFYSAGLTSWLSLQPDIQYFDNPGNNQRNGWAFGLRWLVGF